MPGYIKNEQYFTLSMREERDRTINHDTTQQRVWNIIYLVSAEESYSHCWGHLSFLRVSLFLFWFCVRTTRRILAKRANVNRSDDDTCLGIQNISWPQHVYVYMKQNINTYLNMTMGIIFIHLKIKPEYIYICSLHLIKKHVYLLLL